MNRKNLAQQVPGILEDLKEAVAVAEERNKVLHLASAHGWDFIKKYELFSKSSSDSVVDKAMAAHLAERAAVEKKKRGVKRSNHGGAKSSSGSYNHGPVMMPNFGGFPHAAGAGFPAAGYPNASGFQTPQWSGASFLPPTSATKGMLVCYRCNGFGHKAPDCANKRINDK